eukprot:scaffold34596_cov55-Attheya_sp.AAC.3
MNQFIQRVANYVANRFALRADKHIGEFKGKTNQSLNETLDELHKTATEAVNSASQSSNTGSLGAKATAGPPKPPEAGFAGFISAFGKEIRKDFVHYHIMAETMDD